MRSRSFPSAQEVDKRVEITVFVKNRWPGYCPGSARGSIDWRLRHGQYAASRLCPGTSVDGDQCLIPSYRKT